MRFLVLLLAALTGCATAQCLDLDPDSDYEACKLGVRDARRVAAEEHRLATLAHDHESDARIARDAAVPACVTGDPHACLTVAIYDDAHRGNPRAIEYAYGVACGGDLAFGCFGAGEYAADAGVASRAPGFYERGCSLGEPKACEAAASTLK